MIRKSLQGGVCQVCGFAGIVKKRVMPEMDAIFGTTSEDAKTLWVCLTCFDAPIGCQSANVKHRRLAAEEYRQHGNH